MATAAGGLALFLLAMSMLTEGLEAFAGKGLERLLERATSSPVRGLATGMLLTAMVQSSSAVTIATIGFVNAGMLTLRQALGVIYGTNVGTTMTGWLVSLVGFGIPIEMFALPILALGVGLRLLTSHARWKGLGQALAGFGLFFLGLALLKEAFGGLAAVASARLEAGPPGGRGAYFAGGLVTTVLTQSSSAAIALVLTAAANGVLSVEAAAAAVIGANLGTTSTALLAVLRATAAARRLALAHVVFNALTAVVAFAILPVLLLGIAAVAHVLSLEGSAAVVLALFHTVFNALGVALMLPVSGRLAAVLERRFRSMEEDLRRPQHLDGTLTATPVLALAAVHEELLRLRALVTALVAAAVAAPGTAPTELGERAQALRALAAAVVDFVSRVQPAGMARELADELARALSIAVHLGEVARLVPDALALRTALARQTEPLLAEASSLWEAAGQCLALSGRPAELQVDDAERLDARRRLTTAYGDVKDALLGAAVERRMAVATASELLERLGRMRRLLEELLSADRLLRGPRSLPAVEDGDGLREGSALP